ncbi:MAG: TIGR02281 family clan AA aspartic protease [Pseudomonadota bacterium]
MRIVLVLVAVAVAAYGLYGLNQIYPWILEDSDSLLHLTFLGALLGALLFAGEVPQLKKLRRSIGHLLIWLGVFGALILGYENRDALRLTALRAISGLAPGQPVTLSANETVLTRAQSGHFVAIALVNGERLPMLVDTGASDVAIPYAEAARIGIDVDALSFTRPVLTANGRALVAPVLLDEIEVGGARYYNIEGSVAEPGRLPSALLGMSFLSRLTEFSFRGDKLVLKP